MRYLEIADEIRSLIGAGEFGSGGALPSEAELGRRFPASRVTVRKALEALRREGIVTSRRGSGWFVALDPVRQALGRFSTVEAAMEAAGVTVRREVLEYGFEAAPPIVSQALVVTGGGAVLRVRRLNVADDQPFGVVTVFVPENFGERIARSDAETSTFYELLTGLGVELGSATQTITAATATEDDARLLAVRKGSAVLVCRRVTRDADGAPVLFSEHRYPAHRTSFEVDLPRVAPAGDGPVGLRVLHANDGDREAEATAAAGATDAALARQAIT